MKRRSLLLGFATLPFAAHAATEAEVAAAIRAAVGNAEPVDGGLVLRLPERAENGAQVPVTVLVDTPQTAEHHARAIHLFATRNPTPGIASFRLHPGLARAEIQTRVRVAEDQQIIALAEMHDGTVRRVAVQARVSVGGCA
jgi:sulfur-oxidizing protein SoxY